MMGLHRDSPGPLSQKQFGECLILADAATGSLLDDAGGDVTRGYNGVNGRALDLWPSELAAPGRDRPGHGHADRASWQ